MCFQFSIIIDKKSLRNNFNLAPNDIAKGSWILLISWLTGRPGLHFTKKSTKTGMHIPNSRAATIINIDQTPFPFVLISKSTLEKTGSSRISVPGTSDYCQITGTFTISLSGNFLPIPLIYQRKIQRSQPKFEFPS